MALVILNMYSDLNIALIKKHSRFKFDSGADSLI